MPVTIPGVLDAITGAWMSSGETQTCSYRYVKGLCFAKPRLQPFSRALSADCTVIPPAAWATTRPSDRRQYKRGEDTSCSEGLFGADYFFLAAASLCCCICWLIVLFLQGSIWTTFQVAAEQAQDQVTRALQPRQRQWDVSLHQLSHQQLSHATNQRACFMSCPPDQAHGWPGRDCITTAALHLAGAAADHQACTATSIAVSTGFVRCSEHDRCHCNICSPAGHPAGDLQGQAQALELWQAATCRALDQGQVPGR